MAIKGYTLDTNIIRALMDRNQSVLDKINTAYSLGLHVTLNAIAYYETKRGLEYAQKANLITRFNELCQNIEILYIDEKKILDYAAFLWATLEKSGSKIGEESRDYDILIASIAVVKNYILVTANSNHFKRVPGLQFENWL